MAAPSKPKPKIPPVAPAPTYGGKAKPSKPEKEPGPLKRLAKFVKGDYTKKGN